MLMRVAIAFEHNDVGERTRMQIYNKTLLNTNCMYAGNMAMNDSFWTNEENLLIYENSTVE